MKKIFFFFLLALSTTISKAQKPDLTIQITNMALRSGNSGWDVNYTIKNIGQSAIDLNTVTVQANYQSRQGGSSYPGGGTLISMQSRTLAPNESYQGKMGFGGTLSSGQQYNYSLTLTSTVAEVSTSNNADTRIITAPVTSIKTDVDYFLSAVTVTIQTGADNKEANNSDLYIDCGYGRYTLGSCSGGGYKPEMKINSTTSLTLNRNGNLNYPDNSLQFYKGHDGIQLYLLYDNHAFHTDAWKINSISVKYEFKDVAGNLNTNATKTINYPVNNLLGFKMGDDIISNNKQLRYLMLRTDRDITGPYPNPIIAVSRMAAEQGKRYVGCR